MEATINISVNIPKSYKIELLQKQLSAYAQQLIDSSTKAATQKRKYKHESLCGIFKSDTSEESLIEEYLQEKY